MGKIHSGTVDSVDLHQWERVQEIANDRKPHPIPYGCTPEGARERDKAEARAFARELREGLAHYDPTTTDADREMADEG